MFRAIVAIVLVLGACTLLLSFFRPADWFKQPPRGFATSASPIEYMSQGPDGVRLTRQYNDATQEWTYTVASATDSASSTWPLPSYSAELPLWLEVVRDRLLNANTIDAMSVVTEFRDQSDRANALMFFVDSMLKRQPKSFGESGRPYEPTIVIPGTPVPAVFRQGDLASFATEMDSTTRRALELVPSIEDHGAQSKLYFRIAEVQRRFGNSGAASVTREKAKYTFSKSENVKFGFWSWLGGQVPSAAKYVLLAFGGLLMAPYLTRLSGHVTNCLDRRLRACNRKWLSWFLPDTASKDSPVN